MKICPVGLRTEGNRESDGGEGKERGQGKKMVTGTGREELQNKAVAEKQEFMGSVA